MGKQLGAAPEGGCHPLSFSSCHHVLRDDDEDNVGRANTRARDMVEQRHILLAHPHSCSHWRLLLSPDRSAMADTRVCIPDLAVGRFWVSSMYVCVSALLI